MAERAQSNLEAAAVSPPGEFLPFFFLKKNKHSTAKHTPTAHQVESGCAGVTVECSRLLIMGR